MKPRVVPSRHMCHKHGYQIMVSVEANKTTPSDNVTTPMVIKVQLMCGDVRTYGVDKAYINSSLQMVCEGGFVNEQNEIAKRWEIPIHLDHKE